MEIEYQGTELELFQNANHWKKYWLGRIRPYLGTRILDVGAGIGSTATLLAKENLDSYVALEPDPNNIKVLEEKEGLGKFHHTFSYIQGTVDNLDPNQKFDTILYIDVLEHIEDDVSELKRVIQHLGPEGKIIILSPAHNWLFSPFDTAVGHYRRYDKKSLINAIPAQLEKEKIMYLDSVGIMASLINRLFLKSSTPGTGQIQFWDKYMIPASRLLDTCLLYSFGKTIIGIFRSHE